MDPEETDPDSTEPTTTAEPEAEAEPDTSTAADTSEADAIVLATLQGENAKLTATIVSLSAALVQAKADNYDLLTNTATSDPEPVADPTEDDGDDDLDAAFA